MTYSRISNTGIRDGMAQLSSLYYFYVIAKEGSIAKASRRLRVGQPALSTQLKQLESSLDHALFKRVGQRLQITEIGKIVLDYASEIFRMGSEMVETVGSRMTADRVVLHIGVLDSVPKDVICELVLMAYRKKKCYLSMTEAGSETLFRELKAHKLDLVVTNHPAPIGANSHFTSHRAGELEVVVAGAPKFQSLRRGFPKSLDGRPFLLPSVHSKLRREIETFFEDSKIQPLIIGESLDSELDKRIALAGEALIAIANRAIDHELGEKRLVSLGTLPGLKDQVWLITAKRQIAHPIARDLSKHFTLR